MTLTTNVCRFFSSGDSTTLVGLSLHIHTVRPRSSVGTSWAESITAYVVYASPSSLLLVTVTAGQLNEVAGPRVCEMTGCNVETYSEAFSIFIQI